MAPAATAAPATVVHTVGSKVFVHDAEEGWCKGEVVALQGASLVVKTERGETRTVDNGEDAPLQNADSRGVEVRRIESATRDDDACAPLSPPLRARTRTATAADRARAPSATLSNALPAKLRKRRRLTPHPPSPNHKTPKS